MPSARAPRRRPPWRRPVPAVPRHPTTPRRPAALPPDPPAPAPTIFLRRSRQPRQPRSTRGRPRAWPRGARRAASPPAGPDSRAPLTWAILPRVDERALPLGPGARGTADGPPRAPAVPRGSPSTTRRRGLPKVAPGPRRAAPSRAPAGPRTSPASRAVASASTGPASGHSAATPARFGFLSWCGGWVTPPPRALPADEPGPHAQRARPSASTARLSSCECCMLSRPASAPAHAPWPAAWRPRRPPGPDPPAPLEDPAQDAILVHPRCSLHPLVAHPVAVHRRVCRGAVAIRGVRTRVESRKAWQPVRSPDRSSAPTGETRPAP
jgi:hypothetical protein